MNLKKLINSRRVSDSLGNVYSFTTTTNALYVGDISAVYLGTVAFEDWINSGLKDGVYEFETKSYGGNVGQYAVVNIDAEFGCIDFDGNSYKGAGGKSVGNIGIVDLYGTNNSFDELSKYGRVIEFPKPTSVKCSIYKDEDGVIVVEVKGNGVYENIQIMEDF